MSLAYNYELNCILCRIINLHYLNKINDLHKWKFVQYDSGFYELYSSVTTATRPLNVMKLEHIIKVITFPIHSKEENEMLKLN
jgi:hypothetical protein